MLVPVSELHLHRLCVPIEDELKDCYKIVKIVKVKTFVVEVKDEKDEKLEVGESRKRL